MLPYEHFEVLENPSLQPMTILAPIDIYRKLLRKVPEEFRVKLNNTIEHGTVVVSTDVFQMIDSKQERRDRAA